ncbi:Krueppel c2h2-type zinc finger protein [Penicillium riverlandense]|uniref:Krueppel c2h2-type zinc finger protein n=1 Tax=Penicillium riverlandense TaxID=1903569 RepID=UPI002546F0CE|nr:Krueppel c2h2-type zinc finger protein [Penicillium riverlandense]KAJ5814499.1 Krueppel c2h2-type zinc finger protein [Penicillium riverlandense]
MLPATRTSVETSAEPYVLIGGLVTSGQNEIDQSADSPKQIYQCSSCPKRFVRKDLLRRHEKRHERGMWFRNSGGIVSSAPSRQTSDPDTQRRSIEPASHSTAEPEQFSGIPTASTMNSPPGDPPNMMDTVVPDGTVTSLFMDPSFTGSDPLLDFEWLFDNVPTDFSAPADGGLTDIISPGHSASTTEMSPPSFPMQSQNIRLPAPASPYSFAPWVIVQDRLFDALSTLPHELITSSFFSPSNLSHFYDLYFENYHPHFPILHKSTLDPTTAPPLLMTAIVTLGSTLSSEPAHFEGAVKIHDSLRYIIFNTPDFEPPAALWCVQTLLLIQAQEKMFSTRKHHQLAHIFHGAIITLMKRGVSYASDHQGSSDLEQSWRHWIDIQSSNRTAFFGFVMDAQHSFMFGHTCVLSVQDVRLPLPCPDYVWECNNAQDWERMMRRLPEPPGFLPVLKKLLARTPIPPHCDAYARLILLHGLFSVTAHLKARESATLGVGGIPVGGSPRLGPVDSWKETLEKAMDTWSFCLVSRSSSLALEASKPLHRMAYVAIYTEITDMHILAGAPSLLGNLLSEADLTGATSRVCAWSEKPESKRAIYHCLLLIQEVLFTGKVYRAAHDNLSLRPWSLYHAALILWAYGFMAGKRAPVSDGQGSCGAEEYLVRMLMLLRHDSENIVHVSQQTRELLKTVRECLEGCRWELLHEAYDTLGKLIEMS